MTILVVDDDTLVLGVFEPMLKSRGHEILAAADPATAMSLLDEYGKSPDVLLVDVALAGANGIDFALEVRAEYRDIGVVLTTGCAHREPMARRAGIGEVLRKPFRPQQLFDLIDRAGSLLAKVGTARDGARTRAAVSDSSSVVRPFTNPRNSLRCWTFGSEGSMTEIALTVVFVLAMAWRVSVMRTALRAIFRQRR